MKNIKYTSDGKCSVFCGKTEIARSYIGTNGYEVKVLQGMNRAEIIKKILQDCPDFAASNGIDENYYPYLFSK